MSKHEDYYFVADRVYSDNIGACLWTPLISLKKKKYFAVWVPRATKPMLVLRKKNLPKSKKFGRKSSLSRTAFREFPENTILTRSYKEIIAAASQFFLAYCE